MHVARHRLMRIDFRQPGLKPQHHQEVQAIAQLGGHVRVERPGAHQSFQARHGACLVEYPVGERKAAQAVEQAVMQVTGTKLKSLSAGQMGYSTSEVGDLVVKALC